MYMGMHLFIRRTFTTWPLKKSTFAITCHIINASCICIEILCCLNIINPLKLIFKKQLKARDVKWASPLGFGLALTGRRPNGLDQKARIFSGREYYDLNPNPNLIEFQAKRVKTGYKSNYKFKSKILKQNAQIIQIKYI